MKEKTQSVQAERAILVALVLASREDDFDNFEELSALADTAGAVIIDSMIQRRPRIEPQFYIGKGKVAELADRVQQHEAQVVIFDNDLTPAQIRNIEAEIKCKVLDRSELILDIFATHAQTHQARLQVELAQLQYTYPRLTRMWSHLERIAGAGGGGGVGAVGGIGTRGPGETQLETDRRIVRRQIDKLKQQLEQIDRRRVQEVASRKHQFSVCLVGYTNAGKSTLMKALTGADVYIQDQLFATLDTRTRKWDLGEGLGALLSDTVGFIRQLPHHLVASFRATLEEAIHADLLLHVVDASSPKAMQQIETVEKVLNDLGCKDKNIVTVLNKIDRIEDEASLQVLMNNLPTAMAVSARKGLGLAELTERIRWFYLKPAMHLTLDVRAEAGKLLAFLRKHTEIHSTQYIDSTARIELTVSNDWLGGIRKHAGDYTLVVASDEQAWRTLHPERYDEF